ncbi:MAG: ATP-binding protein, partial [Candidatus Eremiobacterota bacterium]
AWGVVAFLGVSALMERRLEPRVALSALLSVPLAALTGPALLALLAAILALQVLPSREGDPLDATVNLRGSVEESALRDEVARALARAPGLADRLALVLQLAQRISRCRSAVIFEQDGSSILPVASRTPDPERLDVCGLVGTREPVVARAFATHEPAWLDDQGPGERLFEEEDQGVALPLDQRTVLYVGGQGRPWTPVQRRLLQGLAGMVGQGLEAARQVERLAGEAARKRELELHLQRLASLLEISRGLAASLSREQILDTLEACLADLVPHENRALWLAGQWVRGQESGAEEMVHAVMRSDRPLLLEEVGRFPPLLEGQQSLLAVPISVDGEARGVILLGATPRGAFAREHQDQLEVVARQAGLALKNADLHRQVLEAFERLKESEEHLIQSAKLAAVGQLAAGVAHELNTPLGGVLLLLDTLPEQPGGPPVASARASLLRCAKVVEKLLYYSREGRVGHREMDLNETVLDTLLLIGSQLAADFQLNLGDLPRVEGNASELQQMVANLLLNAADAAPKGRVEVGTWVEDARVHLRVRDAGPGVPAELASRVFDPFFTTKPVGRGQGLGLSVSQRIAAAHGGELVLENPGEPGASFRVSLPPT